MLEEQLTDDLLHKMASEASEGAINEAFALGLSITVQKDGKIVEIFPDGSEKITEHSGQLPSKVTKVEYSLGK